MAFIDSHNDGMARASDYAMRALQGLQLLAKNIPTLTDPEGESVGEISNILNNCLQAHQNRLNEFNPLHYRKPWLLICNAGFWVSVCEKYFFDRGYALAGPLRFSLYTTGERLHKATIMYPQTWYTENRDTRKLDLYAGQLLEMFCKMLHTRNIVLYVSHDEPSRYPPWKSDEFLRKQLMDSSIPSILRSHYRGLKQDFHPAYAGVSQKPLDAQDTFGNVRAASTIQEQPSDSVPTSDEQKPPWTTTTAQGPVPMPAGRALEVQARNTGRAPRKTEQEEEYLPLEYQRLAEHLQTGSVEFNKRLAEYLNSEVAMRSAMDQVADSISIGQYSGMVQTAARRSPPENNLRKVLDSHIDAMDTDWNVWDNPMASSQNRKSSSNFQPPIVEEKQPQYEMIQSRPSPVIQKLVPAEGSIAGGTEVIILGNGFYEGLEVLFGNRESAMTTFWGERCLSCLVPPAIVPGAITVDFKHRHQVSKMQQRSQSRASTYKYVDNREVGMYRLALKTLGNEMQSPKESLESTPHHSMAEISRATSSSSSAKETSPVMSNNFTMIVYLAGCLGAPAAQPAETDQIFEEVDRILVSLRDALAVLPLEDQTILSAILLWSIEHVWNHQDRADLHWNGIQVLIQCRPDFDIARPLTRLFTEISLVLTRHEHDSVTKAGRYIAEVFTSALENTMVNSRVNQRVATTAASTPAATVYSPWSETDAEPPPYMLSPTPLKQACLIYAAVNTRNAHR